MLLTDIVFYKENYRDSEMFTWWTEIMMLSFTMRALCGKTA